MTDTRRCMLFQVAQALVLVTLLTPKGIAASVEPDFSVVARASSSAVAMVVQFTKCGTYMIQYNVLYAYLLPGGSQCFSNGLNLYVRDDWKLKAPFGSGPKECGVFNTGKNYDPTGACSSNSGFKYCQSNFGIVPGSSQSAECQAKLVGTVREATEEVASDITEEEQTPLVSNRLCENVLKIDIGNKGPIVHCPYECTPTIFENNKWECEVGDLSGKIGPIPVVEGTTGTGTGSGLVHSAPALLNRSFVLTCSDGTPILCAKFGVDDTAC